jgi:hypothetical protein
MCESVKLRMIYSMNSTRGGLRVDHKQCGQSEPLKNVDDFYLWLRISRYLISGVAAVDLPAIGQQVGVSIFAAHPLHPGHLHRGVIVNTGHQVSSRVNRGRPLGRSTGVNRERSTRDSQGVHQGSIGINEEVTRCQKRFMSGY